MLRGTVKHINPRGFGFIIPDGGNHDYFFHMSALEAIAFDQLREGQRVQFAVASDPKDLNRRRAAQVRPDEEATLPQPPPQFYADTEEPSQAK